MCPKCRHWALLDGSGHTRCCDVEIAETAERRAQRMSRGDGRRRQPPANLRRFILRQQKETCFYCGRIFGTVVWKDGKPFLLRLTWDHFIPFSLIRTNPGVNWVATCHLCNSFKSSLVFENPEEARVHVQRVFEKKGYTESEV